MTSDVLTVLGVAATGYVASVVMVWRYIANVDKRLSPIVQDLADRLSRLEGGVERDREFTAQSLTGAGKRVS